MWILAQTVQTPAPSFSDLVTFYGAASVPLALLILAVVYLVKDRKAVVEAKDKTIEAMSREMRLAMTEQSQATGNFVKVTTQYVSTMTDANGYLKELRDQGIRSTTHWSDRQT